MYSNFEGTNLVHHHDSQKIADSSEEKSVKVVLDSITDRVAERIQNNLSNGEKECSKSKISQWPSFLEGVDNKNDLHDGIYEQFDGGDQVKYNEEANRSCRTQWRP